MFAIKKRTIVMMLACVAALSMILAMFLFTDVASAETVQQPDVAPTSLDSTTLLTGIGSGINVLTATRVNDFKTSYSILDRSALQQLNTSKAYVRHNEEKRYSSAHESELIVDFNLNSSFKMDATIPVPYVGLMQLSEALNVGASLHFSDYTFKYYSMYDYFRRQYVVSIDDSWDLDTYADIYDKTFLKDLQSVENDGMKVSEFFDRYGTHLIGSAYYGGRLTASYSAMSDKRVFEGEITTAIDEAVSFPTISVGFESSLKAQLVGRFGATDVQTVLYISALGGNAFSLSSSEGYTSDYNSWLNSLNDDDKSVIVDYPENGLIPVWEILPAKYSHLSNKLKSEFISFAQTVQEQFHEEYKTGNYIDYEGGFGTASNPYIITNKVQMRNISKHLSACFALANDIDLSNSEWTPIGTKNGPFTGSFDGKGYAIKNLTRTTEYPEGDERTYFGLFGYIGKYGRVQNFNMYSVNINLTGPDENKSKERLFVGAVAGAVSGGKISNVTVFNGSCRFECKTNGMAFVGGVVGLAHESDITNCINNGMEVVCKRNSAAAGGIAGYSNKSNFDYCVNAANVSAYKKDITCSAFSGGIVGVSYSASDRASTFISCRNSGVVATFYFNNKPVDHNKDDIYNNSSNHDYD